MSIDLTPAIKRLFWGDDTNQLNWSKHEKYITQTILDKGDFSDVKWLFSIRSKEQIRQELASLTLSARSQAFWTMYLQ
jgi:hypothetical protein